MQISKIKVSTVVNAPVEKAWEYYNSPEHITQWNSASGDWHTPSATNDLKVGGSFSYRMESKDGKEVFDFAGSYTEVEENRHLAYEFGDRSASVYFNSQDDDTKTEVIVLFDPEDENPIEMQEQGWQGILDNFKKYVGNS